MVVSVQGDMTTTVELIIAEFQVWLTQERGLSTATVSCYARHASMFLRWLPEPLDSVVRELDSRQVRVFVMEFCGEHDTWYAKAMVTAVRAVLRFLHVSGWTRAALMAAVPGVSGWRLASLPRGVDPRVVTRIIDSCDRDTMTGRRDCGVLVVLARLGMRSAEVAGLELGDIDWRAGEVVVRGKGGRLDRLPLPIDVGDALAEYLTARRSGQDRAVFCATRPPFGRLAPCTISTIVGRACDRAGVDRVFAHRLRHSLATEMLRAGASLPEIGQVLRHRSVMSTSIYAKVDVEALKVLARPWPVGGER